MNMNLHDYFAKIRGLGVLGTSNAEGEVDAAIYAKPTVADDNTIAFNMLSRLSYANIQSNPKAAYMFIESGEEYQGKRLYLTKVSEKANALHTQALREKYPRVFKQGELDKHIVCFRVDSVCPLVDDSAS
jgi:hypothetical protein